MKTRIPLPVATSRTAVHAAQRRAADARTTTLAQQMADRSGQVGLLQRLQADADGRAQRKALLFQRAGAEEELLQGRFKTAQLAGPEEDELGHEMIETDQEAGLEEDEPVDEMSESAEVIGQEDEELLQGKFETAQAAGLEEEEPLQARFEHATGRSEPVLRKVDPTTTVNGVPVNDDPALEHEADVMGAKAAQFVPGPEEEEPLQGQFGQVAQKAARQANNTGLPDKLKAGIEHYSGASLDGVKVHYNSAKPAQLNALAYAQGADIHLGPGQEQHLPHEAWHVVQQGGK